MAHVDLGEGVTSPDMGRFDAVQQHVHDRRAGRALAFSRCHACRLATVCADPGVRHLFLQLLIGFDQEAARTAGWVQHALAQAVVQAVDDEAYDGTRRIELAGVASRVAHLFEHGFVEVRDGVNVVGRIEVDVIEFVHDLAQDVAGPDAIIGALKDHANDGADIACVLAAQASKIGDQVVIDEFEQFFAFALLGQALGDDPIAPAVAPLDNRHVVVVPAVLPGPAHSRRGF